ncbi:MAG: DUF423 domain-containing protein [Bauldia sp.]|nr:DUF423 domain-containing protein [Bauldia sp.]
MPVSWFNRLMLVLAGLLGAGGVAAAAGSAHAGGALLQPLALVSLTQAPAMLAFGLASVPAAGLRVGASVIGLGALLFCADLAVRHLSGPSLFPYAAPVGGTAMIAGWALVAVAGLLRRR